MRQHGTYVKYVVEKCHCDACREANRLYERRRTRERLERKYGARPPLFVDASATRAHLFVLSAAGIGPKQVEVLAGVGKTAQWQIRSGTDRALEVVGSIPTSPTTTPPPDSDAICAAQAQLAGTSALSKRRGAATIRPFLRNQSGDLTIPVQMEV